MPAAKEKTGHRSRLRDRFLAREENALTEEGLAELLLTFAIPRKDVRPLAQALVQRFGSISKMLKAPAAALRQVRGIGDAAVALIKLVERLSKEPPRVDGAISNERLHEPLALFPFDDDRPAPAAVVPRATRRNAVADREPSRRRQPKPARRVAPRPPLPIPRKGTGLFGKGLLKDAVECLPRLPDSDSVEEIRRFLREGGLHYSSAETRQRYAQYVVRRMFPGGIADRALRLFAKRFPASQALRDVCFYRFMRAEPVVERCVREVMLPAIGRGTLRRATLRDYLAEGFPDSKPRTVLDTANAIAEVLVAANLARIQKHDLVFRYREVCLESFAFIVHSEFPEPGMHDIGRVEAGAAFQAMLWRPDDLLRCLYELRNRKWIARVAEIDSLRQFTTNYTLESLVQKLVGGHTAP